MSRLRGTKVKETTSPRMVPPEKVHMDPMPGPNGIIMKHCIKNYQIKSINGKIEHSYLTFVLIGPGFSQFFAERFANVGRLEYRANCHLKDNRLMSNHALAPFRRYKHIRFDINLTLDVWPGWKWQAPMWCTHPRSYIDKEILDELRRAFSKFTKITKPVVELTLRHSNRTFGLNELGRQLRARKCIEDALENVLRDLPRVREYFVRVDRLVDFARHGRKAGSSVPGDECAIEGSTKTDDGITKSPDNVQTADLTDEVEHNRGNMRTADPTNETENVEERSQNDWHTSDRLNLDWDSDDDDKYDVCLTTRKFRKYVVASLTEEDREAFYQLHGVPDEETEGGSDESDTDSDDDEEAKAEEMPGGFEWAGGYVRLDYWE
nr:hypothetical protein B0A51_00142 [Rachicladosporium sp. CCFEE 5018]